MALIVETGSGVTGANTYASRAAFLAYALARGVDIDDDDPADVLLIKAMDYLNGIPGWLGTTVISFQPNAWPRKWVYVGCDEWSATAIPPDVVNAQCALAMISNDGIDLLPVYDFTGGLVLEDTVGPITTKYSDKFGPAAGTPDMPAVRSLLRKWINRPIGLNLVRA